MKRFVHIIGTLYLCAVMILLPVSAAFAEGNSAGADIGDELTAGIEEDNQNDMPEEVQEEQPDTIQEAAEEADPEDSEEAADEYADEYADEDDDEWLEQFTYSEPENGIPLVIIYIDENAEDIAAASCRH